MRSFKDYLENKLLRKVNKAIWKYNMITDGDRIAVAISGGKDSLSLLHLLNARHASSKEKYDIIAIHVMEDSNGSRKTPHQPLVAWLKANDFECLNVTLFLPEEESPPLDCQRCSWNRKRTLFEAAQRMGCNVVAFGHNADDLAQTTLLNVIYQGRAETILPTQNYFDGALRVIRPLYNTPETEFLELSKINDFPPPPPPCPQSEDSKRLYASQLMEQMEKVYPPVRRNLLRTGLREINEETRK